MPEIKVIVNEEFSLHNFLLPALQTLVKEKGLNKSEEYPELSFEITGLKPRSQSYSTNIDILVKFNGVPFATGQTYYHMYCDTNLHTEMSAVRDRIFESFHTWPVAFLSEDSTEEHFEKFVDFCIEAQATIPWFSMKYKIYAMFKTYCKRKITEKDIQMLKGFASDVYEEEGFIVMERENDNKLVIVKKNGEYVFGSTSSKAYMRKKLVDQLMSS